MTGRQNNNAYFCISLQLIRCFQTHYSLWFSNSHIKRGKGITNPILHTKKLKVCKIKWFTKVQTTKKTGRTGSWYLLAPPPHFSSAPHGSRPSYSPLVISFSAKTVLFRAGSGLYSPLYSPQLCRKTMLNKCSLNKCINFYPVGFRQATLECATLVCGLFQVEDNQGPGDSRREFSLLLNCLKEFR